MHRMVVARRHFACPWHRMYIRGEKRNRVMVSACWESSRLADLIVNLSRILNLFCDIGAVHIGKYIEDQALRGCAMTAM